MGASDVRTLPCPECLMRGRGSARIGNRRDICSVCNNFAQTMMRKTRVALVKAHPEEYEELRLRVELELYPGVMQSFSERYPGSDA